jgi:hypothetical protein
MIVGSALNTSRVCTATAGSRVSPDYKPDGSPNGMQRRVGRKGRCHPTLTPAPADILWILNTFLNTLLQ